MHIKNELLEPHELSLSSDASWIVWATLASKPHAVLSMVGRRVRDGGVVRYPFFSLNRGVNSANGEHFSLEWPSIVLDADILKKMIRLIAAGENPHPKEVRTLLETSPLFAALTASTILPTKDQEIGDRLLKPMEHIERVALYHHVYPSEFMYAIDSLISILIDWLHDLGKMAGLHYLSENDMLDVPSVRQMLKSRFPEKEGIVSTHPHHDFVGAYIAQRLFRELAQENLRDQENSFLNSLLAPNSDEMRLLLNIIFHHHHFIYNAKRDGEDVKAWFLKETTEKLLPTLPQNRPDLVIRFLMLLAQLRVADIAATPSYHLHWQGNINWLRQTPQIIRDELGYIVSSDEGLMEKFNMLLDHLPQSSDELSRRVRDAQI